MAAHESAPDGAHAIIRSQLATLHTLARCPGLRARYQRLVDAHLRERGAIERLAQGEWAIEQAMRQALRAPGTISEIPDTTGFPRPQPVSLWLEEPAHPMPPTGSRPDPRYSPQPGA